MDKQIDIAVKRARSYWFVDGFTEIALGGLLLLLAAFLLLRLKSSQAPFASWFLSVTGEVTILKVVSFLIVVSILWWLKDHFTYPRTGFVRGKITAKQLLSFIRNLILFLLLPLVSLLIISILTTSSGAVLRSMPIWFPVGLALIWAILVILAGEWMGLLRFRWVGGAILLAGIAVSVWQTTVILPNLQSNVFQPPVLESVHRTLISLSLVLLISGLIFASSGILTFVRYRQENPQPFREGA